MPSTSSTSPTIPPIPKSGRQWTPDQWLGITTVGQSLLVSAAAGSGKTAMLSERCAYLVCDAPEPFRCDVDGLLVVTFTEAAAAEMKTRITAALAARAAASPASERLRKQLALIDQAQVSTLHSFCSRLLRRHFHLVGLDPAFTVMDGDEAKLLRLETARELVRKQYDLEGPEDFLRLVDAYAEGDDERIVQEVIRTHELLTSIVDPTGWLLQARGRIEESARLPIAESRLGRELSALLGARVRSLRQTCDGALDVVSRLGGFPKYVAQLNDFAAMLAHWEGVLVDEGIGALQQEVSALMEAFPATPRVSNDAPGKAIGKGAMDAVRDGIKGGPWRELLRFSAEDWQDGIRRVLPHALTLLDLVEAFGREYADRKEAARQLDFADLERFALRVLREPGLDGLVPTPTARHYHRLFRHVLVDEYQDINELQDSIIALLSHETNTDEGGRMKDEKWNSSFILPPSSVFPNLFCVGDVKQSIYRFRLAEPDRFLRREHLLRNAVGGAAAPGRVIDLQANFRSRGPLLEAINGVFERLMTREAAEIEYDAAHRLVPGKPYPETAEGVCFAGAPIELHLLPKSAAGFGAGEGDESDGAATDAPGDDLDRTEREAVFLARRIRSLVGADGTPPMQVMEESAGGMQPRPIRFGDVVILLRSMRYKADQYADVLRRAGVPVRSQSGTGYFESTEVRDVLALLNVLDNQRQDIPLATMLRSRFAAIENPEDALARIRLAYNDRAAHVPFHQAVVSYAKDGGDALAAELRAFLLKLDRWRRVAYRRPLEDLFRLILEDTGYLAYVSGLPDGQQRTANLLNLRDRARAFATHQRRGLARFLRYLETLRDEADLGIASTAGEGEDVVRIMSVHRSKGLEFPVVVLPDLGKGINLKDAQGAIVLDRAAGLGMAVVDDAKQVRYPSLAQVLVQERLRRLALAEELRVLYVAMTRAKEHLILLGTTGETSWEKWQGRWSDHRGPLPAEAILGARSLLDWVGVVAACAPGAMGEIIRVTAHAPGDVAQWEAPGKAKPADDARLALIADLRPLDPAPAESALAREVIDRLQFQYAFENFAKLAAARSVTGEAKEHAPLASGYVPPRDAAVALAEPNFTAGAIGRSAVHAGTATHLVMQHLDFRGPLDAADVAAQIEKMVKGVQIGAEQAAMVRRDSIVWFGTTDVGQLLRERHGKLLRELPVYYAAPDEGAADPRDLQMVRGRLDLVVRGEGDEGATIIDFKTDAVAPADVARRADTYAGQMRQYKLAVERITGRPVARVCLVFLTARVIWDPV